MLRYLKADIQTRFDLGIQESPNGEHPLPLLFLHTETKEGKRMMRNWITHPLSDIPAIQARQEAIAWEGLPALPMDEDELDFLEHYLEFRDQIPTKGVFYTLYNKIGRLFKYDSTRYVITRGVKLCIRFFKQLEILHKELPDNPPKLIQEWTDNIQSALQIEELKALAKIKEEEDFSDFQIDNYDYLFRHEQRSLIRDLLTGIYLLDVCRTARFIAQERGYCCTPTLHETGGCDIQGFRHPFVKNAQKNDWRLTNGNIAIFTGSNMAGWYCPQGIYHPEELGGLSVKRFCAAMRAEGVDCCWEGANYCLHTHAFFKTFDLHNAGKPTRVAYTDHDVREDDEKCRPSENILCFQLPWFKHFDKEWIDKYVAAFRKVADHYEELLPGDDDKSQGGRWYGVAN